MISAARTLLIARRELRSLFLTPLAWVVLAGTVFLGGASFVTLVRGVAPGTTALEAQRFLFLNLLLWTPLLVAIPLIAMRLLTEERRSGTLEALLTAPVSEGEVVAGKFAAGVLLVAALLVPTALHLALLEIHGTVDWGAALGGLAGLLLVGAFLLAASFVAASATASPTIAVMLGFALVIAFQVGPLIGALLIEDALVLGALDHVNLWRATDELSSGLLSTKRLVYPLSGIAFMLFASARILEGARGR